MAKIRAFMANGGGGSDVNKFPVGSTFSSTVSSFADTGVPVSEARYVALFMTLSGTVYKDLFRIENGVATYVDGNLYNGSPLFRVDVSGSTVKIGQSGSSSAQAFSAVVLSEV